MATIDKNALESMTLLELSRQIKGSKPEVLSDLFIDVLEVLTTSDDTIGTLSKLVGTKVSSRSRTVIQSFGCMTFRRNIVDLLRSTPEKDKFFRKFEIVREINPQTGEYEDFMGESQVFIRVDDSTGLMIACCDSMKGYVVNVELATDFCAERTDFDLDRWIRSLTTPNLFEGLVLNLTKDGLKILSVDKNVDRLSSYSDRVERSVAEFELFLRPECQEALRAAGLPIRQAVLIEGPPGSGKSTLVRRIVSHAPDDVTVIIIEPDAALEGIDDLNNIFEKTIVVFEDVDSHSGERGSYHFTKFLNCVDGVGNSSGVRLFLATTNDSTRLDPAVLRPGRFDTNVFVGPIRFEGLISMFESNFQNWSSDQLQKFVEAVVEGVGADRLTPALSASLSRKIIVNGFGPARAIAYVQNEWKAYSQTKDHTEGW